jgi:hypothetical protein
MVTLCHCEQDCLASESAFVVCKLCLWYVNYGMHLWYVNYILSHRWHGLALLMLLRGILLKSCCFAYYFRDNMIRFRWAEAFWSRSYSCRRLRLGCWIRFGERLLVGVRLRAKKVRFERNISIYEYHRILNLDLPIYVY